jgi:formate dehydrogenase subunit gamma
MMILSQSLRWLCGVLFVLIFTFSGTNTSQMPTLGGQSAFAQEAAEGAVSQATDNSAGSTIRLAPSVPTGTTLGSSVRPPSTQKWGEPAASPVTILPQPSDSTVWGRIRLGNKGTVSIPDKRSGVLVQSQGETWRLFRTGPLKTYGAWLLAIVLIVLALHYSTRGPIKIERGLSGRQITRFNAIERFTHWLTAGSFVVLGLTGLNVLYGRNVILPIIGADAFSFITLWGKWLHNFMAFAFIAGLVLTLVMWVSKNFWDKYDIGWIRTGGGMFKEGVHPPARKFNTGQKFLFWAVIIAGGSVSYSGLGLLFPFQFAPFDLTFTILNFVGFNLPTDLELIQEMQLMQTWHAIVALLLTGLIIAHIYIGTLGMEGAVDAMWSGDVDENWARQHHSAWVAEIKGEPAPAPLAARPHAAAQQAGDD